MTTGFQLKPKWKTGFKTSTNKITEVLFRRGIWTNTWQTIHNQKQFPSSIYRFLRILPPSLGCPISLSGLGFGNSAAPLLLHEKPADLRSKRCSLRKRKWNLLIYQYWHRPALQKKLLQVSGAIN